VAEAAARHFAAAMAGFGPFPPAPRLAVGVSGGPDSLALLLLADGWARARGGDVLGLVVDHGLRAASAAEAEATASLLARRGVAARVVRLCLPAGPRLQERARTARLSALAEAAAASGRPWLLLGHQREDVAETLAFRAARGSGEEGLAAIPPLRRQGEVLLCRPVLGLPRAALEAVCRQAGLAPLRDPMNRDPRFARARLRAALTEEATAALAAAAAALARRRAEREAAVAARLAAACAWHSAGAVRLDAAALGRASNKSRADCPRPGATTAHPSGKRFFYLCGGEVYPSPPAAQYRLKPFPSLVSQRLGHFGLVLPHQPSILKRIGRRSPSHLNPGKGKMIRRYIPRRRLRKRRHNPAFLTYLCRIPLMVRRDTEVFLLDSGGVGTKPVYKMALRQESELVGGPIYGQLRLIGGSHGVFLVSLYGPIERNRHLYGKLPCGIADFRLSQRRIRLQRGLHDALYNTRKNPCMKPGRVDVIQKVVRIAARRSVGVISGNHEMRWLKGRYMGRQSPEALLPQSHRHKTSVYFHPKVGRALSCLKTKGPGIELRFHGMCYMARVTPPHEANPWLKVGDIGPGHTDFPHPPNLRNLLSAEEGYLCFTHGA
jgi:tRNA(Ile)-lysidine synthetase-like protein